MIYQKQLRILFSFFCLFFLSLELKAKPKDLFYKKSLVLLEVTSSYYNPVSPWIRENVKPYYSLALVVGRQKLLTLSTNVQNAVLIEASKYNSYTKVPAKILRLDYEANLALLSVEDKSFFQNLKSLPFSKKDAIPNQKVNGVHIDSLFNVFHDHFAIQDIYSYTQTGYVELPLYIFRSQEQFALGGILLCPKKVCGWVSYSNPKGNGEAILASIMLRFLKNKNKSASNFISQGYSLTSLVDPVLRKYYGIPKGFQGALVSRVLPFSSSFGKLQKGDILLEIDNVKIDKRGYYQDKRWGRQISQFLFLKKGKKLRQEKDKASLKILRKKKLKKLSLSLKSTPLPLNKREQIPSILTQRPPYFIENGIVFVELSVPLLQSLFGKQWRAKSSVFNYLYQSQKYYEKKSDNRFVIISDILPHKVNQDIENFRGTLVKKVEGKKIRNLKDLYQSLQSLIQKNKKTAKLELYAKVPLFLDLENRKAINQKLQKRYQIPTLSYF